jgi:hypothetical protein
MSTPALAGRAEEVVDRLEAVPGLRVVLNVVLDDQLVEGVGVAGAKCIEEPAHAKSLRNAAKPAIEP